MASSPLYKQINYVKAYRKHRWDAAQWVLSHPETLPELLSLCFLEDEGDISYKATWVLEFVCLEDLALLYPLLDDFFGSLAKVKKDQSLRPLSHICELLCIRYYKENDSALITSLTDAHKTIMTECAFDWLISDQKVACQVRAMTALYYLGEEFDWIHTELKQIIERNIHEGSAGYKARGRHILEKIAKFRRSTM